MYFSKVSSPLFGAKSAKASRKLNATNMCVEAAAQAASTHLLPLLLALQR